MNNAHWLKCRKVVERVIIEGDLILETPAGFGTGDHEAHVDIPLALDPLDGKPLLTGSSLAGALRSYLREREHGYRQIGNKNSLYSNLFGIQEDNEGEQSLLIVCDSISDELNVELRDGVRIDPCTRTAQDKKKFDFELIEAGTCFHIKIELLLQEERKEQLMKGLVIALQGLERGEIPLGVRKRRGFGQCRVKKWKVCRYDLTKPDGLIGWLTNDIKAELNGPNISDILKVTQNIDNRDFFIMDATFSLDGSLLIRSGFDDTTAPDMVHLHSKRKKLDNTEAEQVPVLSGTSLAGALRARALRIAKTIGKKRSAKNIVDRIFGSDMEPIHLFTWNAIPEDDSFKLIDYLVQKFDLNPAPTPEMIEKSGDGKILSVTYGKIIFTIALNNKNDKAILKINGEKFDDEDYEFIVKTEGKSIHIYESRKNIFASRLITAETEIIKPLNLVQSRVKIDRFTGGSFPTALFNAQPVFGQSDTDIRLKITVQQPDNAQIGLLLLLLKDLWTGDLPLGGEVSVGRGRLSGKHAELKLKQAKIQDWTILQANNRLDIGGNQEQLEQFVQSFVEEIQK